MKKYIIIAGVNGSGKSTLYQTQRNLQDMPRVNTDEILKEFGDWRNVSDLLKAGKIAVNRLKECLRSELTFNQETTLCGRSVFRMVEQAKEQGFYIEMHYIGVDSAEIAKERVKHRIDQGGHGVPDKDIERRYTESFENLLKLLPECNLVVLYDNTADFRRFAIYRNANFVRVSKNRPMWFERRFKL